MLQNLVSFTADKEVMLNIVNKLMHLFVAVSDFLIGEWR